MSVGDVLGRKKCLCLVVEISSSVPLHIVEPFSFGHLENLKRCPHFGELICIVKLQCPEYSGGPGFMKPHWMYSHGPFGSKEEGSTSATFFRVFCLLICPTFLQPENTAKNLKTSPIWYNSFWHSHPLSSFSSSSSSPSSSPSSFFHLNLLLSSSPFSRLPKRMPVPSSQSL